MNEREVWTLDRIVAWNLRKARQDRGWSQEELGQRLAPYLGEEWSKALVSQAERSLGGSRIRPFRADELLAFSQCLKWPILMFFLPPHPGCFVGAAQAGEGVTLEDPVPAEDWFRKLIAPTMPVAVQMEWASRGGAPLPEDFWSTAGGPAAPLLETLSRTMEQGLRAMDELQQGLQEIAQIRATADDLERPAPGRQKGKRKPKEEGDAG